MSHTQTETDGEGVVLACGRHRMPPLSEQTIEFLARLWLEVFTTEGKKETRTVADAEVIEKGCTQ
jgi:hypothetical protein